MAETFHHGERARPEALIHRLRARIGRHALWDSLLIFVSPILILLYAVGYFAQIGRLGVITAVIIALSASGFAVLAVTLRGRLRMPQLFKAARLVDEHTGAKDHFLTVATIDPAAHSPDLVARLHQDTETYASRVELRRDFPYKPKRSAAWSAGGSILALLLLAFFLPKAGLLLQRDSAPQRLNEIADQLAKVAGLNELSQELKTLAAQLDDPKLQAEEKRAAVEKLEQMIADRQRQEEEKKNRDMLSQAASALRDLEEQQSSDGTEPQSAQSKSGGNLQSNLPQDGKGESKQSKGSGGDGKGEMSAQMDKHIQEGKSAQGNPKEPAPNKNQERESGAQGNQPDPNRAGKESSKNDSFKGQGGSKEGSGKNQASEEPPQSAPPAERFYQAGEGKEGIKGARYITVQLPEDVVAESKGGSAPAKESKNNRARAPIPVSNAPLPAHVPNAPLEKQQMPIEYRGIIR